VSTSKAVFFHPLIKCLFPFLQFLDTLPNPFAGKLLPTASAARVPEFLGTRLVSRDGKKSAAGSFVFLSEKREFEYLQRTKEQPLSRFVVSRFAQGCSLLIFHPIRFCFQ
jgi:hypothetical protein